MTGQWKRLVAAGMISTSLVTAALTTVKAPQPKRYAPVAQSEKKVGPPIRGGG